MSGTTTPSNDQTTTGAAPGGGGSGGTSVGGSTSGVTAPVLPPQYATGNLGFFTRQTEAVTSAVTVGPDGALYVGELNGIPYPDGYSSVVRIGNPSATTGFDGKIASGVPQTYASGFSEVQSLSFNNSTGDMYVLEYLNSNEVYDPTKDPASLPASLVIKVAPDGTRTTISGPEAHLSNYVLVDQKTGDVYVSNNNNGPGTGNVVKYHTGADGSVTNSVVASGLNDPRGLSFGPDGNLYVLEQGNGTPASDPNAASAPVIPFIPGLVSERGGYTGSITKVDTTNPAGGQDRVYTGLPSFQEFNPTTGQDRVNSIGPNAFTITPDGTVYIASGGGLAPETAVAVGAIGNDLQGVLKLTGLFGDDPSKASYTTGFNALAYASQNGPDGATTLFNTESNLYDITQGADGKLYTIDAARNSVYGLSADGNTVESVTVLQKQPPVLTPPQYAAEVAAGGNPTEQYQAEIANVTYKNVNSLPNVPGNVPVAAAGSGSAPAGAPAGVPSAAPASGAATPAANTDSSGVVAGATAVPTPSSGTAATGATTAPTTATTDASGSTGTVPPHGEDTLGSGVTNTTMAATGTAATTAPATTASTTGAPTTGASSTGLPTLPTSGPPPSDGTLPGPVDPVSPPVLATNIYSPYFNPFFGNYAPAPSDPLVLPAGNGGQYAASKLVVFGDRLADNGNTKALQESLGQAPGQTTAPYSPTGDFSDGPKWTTDLAQMLGATAPSQQQNFAYESATARDLGIPNPFDPNASKTPLSTFAGQIQQFAKQDGSFSTNDVVSVTFGGNDISLPSAESPEQGVNDSVKAIVSGLQQAADLGAKHFLVSNLPDITLAPLFSEPAFLAATGATQAQFQGLVSDFNTQLATGLKDFQSQTGLDVKTLDLDTLFKGIAADPFNYGFTNVTQPVLSSTPGTSTTPTYNPAIVGQDPQVEHGTLFLDPYFDPTALGQAIIAQTARSTLTA